MERSRIGEGLPLLQSPSPGIRVQPLMS